MAEVQERRGAKFKNASVQRHRGGRDSCGKWWCRLLAYCVLIYTRVRGSCSLRFGARKNISWVLCHRAKVEVKPCVHLFNRASLRKVSSYFFFLVRHFRSSTFRRDCFRRTCALFQIFVAVEFHRGMRHFHLSLCSFVDTLRT